MSSVPELSAVVLAFGAEPTLERCVEALQATRGIDIEIVVVDNGCDPARIEAIRSRAGVVVLGPPRNRGFAGGCNHGVEQSTGAIVALINSDAFVEPDALATLAQVARRPDVGIASASLRLAATPELMNSAGNPVHFTGLTWSGAFGEPATAHPVERDITSATGAALAMRRSNWEALGGFDDQFFAYLEDTDLSLRSWLTGQRVVYVPDSIVHHEYEFGRNQLKFYLLERNRLLLLATAYSGRALILLAPALLLFELAMVAQAAGGGWLGQKAKGWVWLARNGAHIRARRRMVRGSRTVADAEWMNHLCGRIEPANVTPPRGMQLLNAVLGTYWRIVRPLL